MSKIVDLTQEFYVGMPRPARLPAPSISPISVIGHDPVNVMEIRSATHIGTHIDAPRHVFADGQTLDTYPIERFTGPVAILNLPKDPLSAITRDNLEDAAPGANTGDCVLIRTGWGALYGNDQFHDHPYLTEEAARWLVERQTPMVGIDFLTPDTPGKLRSEPRSAPNHRILLGNNVLIIEVLNLEQVYGQRGTLFAFPLKIRSADGAPARVVVELDDHSRP